MKRKVLFMTLAMAVVLTACGGNADKAAGSNADANVSEEAGAAADDGAESTDTADDVQAATADEAGVGAADAEAGAEAEEEGGGEAAAGKYAKGSVSETGWESEFFGLRYTAPEGMGMSTEEELNDLMGLGQEVLSDDFSELQLKYCGYLSILS